MKTELIKKIKTINSTKTTIKKLNLVSKNLPMKKILGSDNFTVKIFLMFKEDIVSILYI